VACPWVVRPAKKGVVGVIGRGLERGGLEPQLRVCGGERELRYPLLERPEILIIVSGGGEPKTPMEVPDCVLVFKKVGACLWEGLQVNKLISGIGREPGVN